MPWFLISWRPHSLLHLRTIPSDSLKPPACCPSWKMRMMWDVGSAQASPWHSLFPWSFSRCFCRGSEHQPLLQTGGSYPKYPLVTHHRQTDKLQLGCNPEPWHAALCLPCRRGSHTLASSCGPCVPPRPHGRSWGADPAGGWQSWAPSCLSWVGNRRGTAHRDMSSSGRLIPEMCVQAVPVPWAVPGADKQAAAVSIDRWQEIQRVCSLLVYTVVSS